MIHLENDATGPIIVDQGVETDCNSTHDEHIPPLIILKVENVAQNQSEQSKEIKYCLQPESYSSEMGVNLEQVEVLFLFFKIFLTSVDIY